MKNIKYLILFIGVLSFSSCKETYKAISYVDNSKYHEIEDGVFVSISEIGTDLSVFTGNYYYYPKKGSIYYIVVFKLFNQSNKETKIDISKFRLQDSNGDLYDIAIYNSLRSGKPKLKPKDAKMINNVAFEYPINKRLHKLVYKGKSFRIDNM